MLANLSLVEDLVDAARRRFAAQLKLLDEAHVPIELKEEPSTQQVPGTAVTSGDVIALVRAMDRIADKLLVESNQKWASAEYLSGNAHKVGFERRRLRRNRSEDGGRASAAGNELRRLARLAVLSVEFASLLEEASADLVPPKRG
jgi:hypothetical protein